MFSFLGKKGEQLQIEGDCVETRSISVTLTSVKRNVSGQIDSFLFFSEEFFQSTETG